MTSFVNRVLKFFIGYLLRFLFSIRVLKQRSNQSAAGFILPTTVLLLLVVSLAVGAISLRTLGRTEQTIGARQQQVIFNAATPVLDRARAKIDHLLAAENGHPRTSTGIPPEDDLVQMMLNEPGSPFRHDAKDPNGNPINLKDDIYTFDDEDRVNIGELDGIERMDEDDNAWEFTTDTDGDGTKDAYVVYSILFNTPDNDPNNTALKDATLVTARAPKLEVRHGPKSLIRSTDRCPAAQQAGIEDGWFSDEISTAFLRKNFQVDAVVIPGIVDDSGNLTGPDPRATVVTLEFHQDRTFDRGNKWGAWFRNDIEAFPGPDFRWNGAMHSEGSLIIGKNGFPAYLISSEYSCFNVSGASEISVGNDGQVIIGRVDDQDGGVAPIHIYDGYGNEPDLTQKLTTATDSVGEPMNNPDAEAISGKLLLDPVKLLASNESVLRDDPEIADVTTFTQAEWKLAQPELSKRITLGERELLSEKIDDIYRDGYWEESAKDGGTRIIVGQRLELGEPLEPWSGCPGNAAGRCHEARQRRSLSDKLAAVQATVIYESGSTEPLACLATTVHPGTVETLKRAATFHDFNSDLGNILTVKGQDAFAIDDFFTGRGTNGWEFQSPSELNSNEQTFMDTALENLANFAGDPQGGAPFFPAVQDNTVHPYPYMAEWGDFSILRRVIDSGSTTTAAQSYRDTASCMLGMLAHNISYLNQLEAYLPFAVGGLPGQVGQKLDDVRTNTPTVPLAIRNLAPGNPSEYIDALEQWNDIPGEPITPEMVETARQIMTMAQVKRDRQRGFDSGVLSSCPADLGGGLNLDMLCPIDPKYPALFSIFPLNNHFEGTPSLTATRGRSPLDLDPAGTQYLATAAVNLNVEYQALDNSQIEKIALRPRKMTDWKLPHDNAPGVPASAPNSPDDVLIKCDNVACDGTDVRVAFKDAGIMDGRQLMSVRILDLNMDMFKTMLPDQAPGLVYAFREDAIREDAIVRPAGSTAANCTNSNADLLKSECRMDASVDAFTSIDPPLTTEGISLKPVDYYPDPDRRPYGFRLRNGEQLNRSLEPNVDESISFISSNPVYIMGDFNLHQNTGGTKLEEFKGADVLDTDTYKNFYGRGKVANNVNADFGKSDQDLWRPTEVLSDGGTILSNDFCDGSISDALKKPASVTPEEYGCDVNNFTSYTNYTYPTGTAPSVRENSFDSGSPIRIGNDGNPDGYSGSYRTLEINRKDHITEPKNEVTVNVVMYSAAVPSRLDQSYGGLHNFPRLLEDWDRQVGDTPDNNEESLNIAGAFFQLGFSTSATAPYDQEEGVFEPQNNPDDNTSVHEHYDPPKRKWGYDVALQKNAPAAVAKEFTSNSPLVSEFYSEPPLEDPYISQLCDIVDGAVCPE